MDYDEWENDDEEDESDEDDSEKEISELKERVEKMEKHQKEFCPKCGSRLKDSGWSRGDCPKCDNYELRATR